MKTTIAIAMAVVLLTACRTLSGARPEFTARGAHAVYEHQQRQIQFTPEVREDETRAFLTLINHYRREKGLRPLVLDPELQKAAQWMSEDMAGHDSLGHTDSLGRNPFTRMAEFGYAFNTDKAENVAAGQEKAGIVFSAWQNSPAHNANMLNSHFTVIGIGFAYSRQTEYGWFWATTFGGRKSPLP
jgi:uncharacterized protein YkwD